MQAAVAGGLFLRPGNGVSQLLRKRRPRADEAQPDTVFVQVIDLFVQGADEQVQQQLHLLPRPPPVFAAEGEHRQELCAPLGAMLDDAAQGFHPGLVSRGPGQLAPRRPAPVAVHDYYYMSWQVVVLFGGHETTMRGVASE